MTHRFIHSLLENRLSRNSSLQFVIVDSECRVVDMDAYTDNPVCINIAIVGISIVGIIVVVGIIGNSLTFVVFRKGNFKSSTSFLFLSLSLIDSVVLLTSITSYIVEFDFYTRWLSHDLRIYLQVCVWPVLFVAETATIWVTVLIAVNRYIIVCIPLRATQWCTLSKVKIQLAVVLVWSVMYNIPQMARYRIVHITPNNGTLSYVTTRIEMGPPSFPQFYYVYDIILALLVLVCLPLFILTALTFRLIKAMKDHRRMQAEMQRQNSQPDSSLTCSQPDSSLTCALIVVVIVAIICRVPLLVWMVMLILEWKPSFALCIIDITYFTLLTLNSAVNFVIYILINRRFRNVLFANVCRRRSAIPEVSTDTMTTSPRETATPETGDGSDTRL